jgi:hypothetical protein
VLPQVRAVTYRRRAAEKERGKEQNEQVKRRSKSGERRKPARKHYAIEPKSLDHILAVRSDRMSITEQGVRMLCKDGSNSVTYSYRFVRSSRYLRPLSQKQQRCVFLQAAFYVSLSGKLSMLCGRSFLHGRQHGVVSEHPREFIPVAFSLM